MVVVTPKAAAENKAYSPVEDEAGAAVDRTA
jgi:hypothetical protein